MLYFFGGEISMAKLVYLLLEGLPEDERLQAPSAPQRKSFQCNNR